MTPYFDVRYTEQGTRITIVESVTSARQINRLLPHYISFWELQTVIFEMLKEINVNCAYERWIQFLESRSFKDDMVITDGSTDMSVSHMVHQLYHTQLNEDCSHFLISNAAPYICLMVDYENYGLWTLTKARAVDLVDSYLLDTVTDSRNAVRSVLTMLIHMTSFVYKFFLCDHVLYDAAANAGSTTNGWTSLMQRITTEEFVRNLPIEGKSEKEIERKRQVYKRCWDLVLQKRWGEV